MLTNNGKKLVRICGTFNGSATGMTDWNGVENISLTGGLFRDAVYKPFQAGVNTQGSFIKLGDSDDPVTVSQYNIQGNDLTGSLTRVGYVKDDNNVVNLTVTYRNDTNDAIVVKEIAYYVWAGYDPTNSIMVSRHVFANPINIGAGETKAFTVVVNINPT